MVVFALVYGTASALHALLGVRRFALSIQLHMVPTKVANLLGMGYGAASGMFEPRMPSHLKQLQPYAQTVSRSLYALVWQETCGCKET